MRDLARTIEPDDNTSALQVHQVLPNHSAKELRIEFGRHKREALLALSQHYRTLHLTKSERDLLHQIIHRSKQGAPWEYDSRKYGPTQLSEAFGLSYASFKRAVASLVRKGDLKVVKINRSRHIYRVPETTMNAIKGRGNVTPQPIPSGSFWALSHKESSSLCEAKPAPVLGSEHVASVTVIRSSNSRDRDRGERRKAFPNRSDLTVAPRGQEQSMDDDDGPVLGRDPEAVRDDPAKGTKVTQIDKYFRAAWSRVKRDPAYGFRWDTVPYASGGIPRYRAWIKQVLLPACEDDLALAKAVVDMFCMNHSRFYVPGKYAVYQQLTRRLETIKKLAVSDQPGLYHDGGDTPDEATLERHRAYMARAEAAKAKRAQRG